MEDVGIKMEKEYIITYNLLKRLPASLDIIKQSITHSNNGEDIMPETLLDHLEIHQNELKLSASTSKLEAITMYTEKEERCSLGKHNTRADHPAECCWFDANKANTPWLKRQESNVSSFSSFSSIYPFTFVLNSGLSSHMVSDKKLFISLDEIEGGLINTSCGSNSLEIKGKGSITVCYRKKPLVFHNVLFVPKIAVNLLSLRQLLLEKCNVQLNLNQFAVRKNDEILIEGHYHNNIPMLNFEKANHHLHLSQAENLHKSLGHVS